MLVFCESCGFIFNVVFDPSKVAYSSSYEDQQCFSPTFNAFAQTLASHLIEKYNLYDKRIIEIGCGKGDFLALLCELGNNSGVGFDPAYVDRRNPSYPSNNLLFIQDYYTKRYANHRGDLVCCRHTLEHIPNTAEFLRELRKIIGDRLDTIVFFEVPDTTRILNELAFWDIYYEHCSYFTPGSLARLFRSCKFEVIGLSKGFGDQYILIETRPVNRKPDQPHELEKRVEELAKDVMNYSTHYKRKLDYWKAHLNQMYVDERRVVVWGSGSKCVSFMTAIDAENKIKYVIDINPFRHGKYLPGVGRKIMPPEFLKNYEPDTVIVLNRIYCDEIKKILHEMDLTPEVISV